MNDAVPILLAVCFLFSLPVAISVAAGPATTAQQAEQASVEPQTAHTDQSEPIVVDGTTSRLVLTGELFQSHSRSHGDIGTTVGLTDQTMRADYDRFELEADLTELDTEEQAERLDEAFLEIESSIEDLEERERGLINGHSQGTVSEGTVLRGLVSIHFEAELLLEELDFIVKEAEDREAAAVSAEEASEYEAQIQPHRSDVRAAIASTNAGDGNDGSALVKTSESGSTVAVLTDEAYLRETIRYDNRNPGPDQELSSISELSDRAEVLYPWVFSEGTGGTSFNQIAEGTEYAVWTFSAVRSHGELQSYFDATTGSVFYELQQLEYREIPVSTQAENENNGLTMQFNQTAGGGPAEVTVTDEDGDPVNATVSIGDERVGETGADGSLWVLPPRGEYTMIAESDDRAVGMGLTND